MPMTSPLGPPPEDDAVARRRAVAEAEARLFGGEPAPVRVGRFTVRGRLGAGGLGVVWEAHDPELDRVVALKLLRPERAAGADAEERVLREGRAMARLAHPNVVVVHEVGVHEGRVFLSMERVEGSTLRAWLAGEPAARVERTRSAVLDVVLQAGRGLAAAHAAGLVHRDFKPENVLVGADGRVRVTDFGLARPAGADAPPAGTPAYMAPEQGAGGQATPAADQYAFCLVAQEALGRGGAGAPVHVARALARGLAADPAARWGSMGELLAALADDPRRRRRRAVIGAVVALVLAVALAAAVLQVWMFARWMSAARTAGAATATATAMRAGGVP